MRANRCAELSEAITAVAALDLSTLDAQLADLCVAELQALTGRLVPVLIRLGAVQTALLGELTARAGGTVPSAPLPQDPAQTPGPSVLIAHWLRGVTGSTGAAAVAEVRTARLLRQLPLVLAAVLAARSGWRRPGC